MKRISLEDEVAASAGYRTSLLRGLRAAQKMLTPRETQLKSREMQRTFYEMPPPSRRAKQRCTSRCPSRTYHKVFLISHGVLRLSREVPCCPDERPRTPVQIPVPARSSANPPRDVVTTSH